jgi:hypothetical protein
MEEPVMENPKKKGTKVPKSILEARKLAYLDYLRRREAACKG